ncbi:MAG: DUF1801 domain-containing protein [Rhodobacter sp.]|nr:DUF1801 domain-containing protein [Rhodobacter sp.]
MTPRHKGIDDYIRKRAEAVIPLLEDLRAFIHHTLPGATEGMQYGAPVFFNAHGVPVIYLFGSKNHVNFGFLRSSELSDPRRLLKGSGKPSKHIKVYPGKPVDKAILAGFIEQCESLTP